MPPSAPEARPGAISIPPVTNIAAYVKAIRSIRGQWSVQSDPPNDVWFRGVRRDDFELVPGAYWHEDYDESSLANMFRQMAPAYLDREPTDDWEWYFLMQHYGLPTRLLDWTESPLAALYFALVGATATDSRPAVWVLDPAAVNEVTTGADDCDPLIPGGEFTRHWLPGAESNDIAREFDYDGQRCNNREPIAIIPKRRDRRIVAQHGVFTLHGSEKGSIADLLEKKGDRRRARLVKVPIARKKASSLKQELDAMQITQTALFPELTSLVIDLRRVFGVQRPVPGPQPQRASKDGVRLPRRGPA